MRFAVGMCMFDISFLWQKKPPNSPYYYRRRVPKDVQLLSPNKSTQVAISLRTKDPQEALKRGIEVNEKYEREWELIRGGVNIDGERLSHQLLDTFGLNSIPADEQREHKEANLEALSDHLDKITRGWGKASPPRELTFVEREAVSIIKGEYRPTLDDAEKTYLINKGWSEDDPSTRKDALGVVRHFRLFKTKFDGVALEDIKRRDVKEYLRELVNQDGEALKTTTLNRMLSTVRRGVKEVFIEWEITRDSPFNSITIPNLGEDSESREPASRDVIEETLRFASDNDDQVVNLIGLIAGTGMRVNEAIGLEVTDLVIDSDTPHIRLQPNSARKLKTMQSERLIPLIGISLSSARKALIAAERDGVQWLFPKYIHSTHGTAKNGGASATLNKRLKNNVTCVESETMHSFRHGMNKLFKDAGVTEEVREQSLGWSESNKPMARHYGGAVSIERVYSVWKSVFDELGFFYDKNL
jgi:integrase